MTKIEWATKTWDIVEGCTKVSRGCKNCYAERLAKRFGWPWEYVKDQVWLQPHRMRQPYNWPKGQYVFVCSRSDLFHRAVPGEYVHKAFEIMADTPWHRYLLLTKRPELAYTAWNWPENVWLGVSVEGQPAADARLSELMQVAITNGGLTNLWVSAEPMVGELDLRPWLPKANACNCKCGCETHHRPVVVNPAAHELERRYLLLCSVCWLRWSRGDEAEHDLKPCLKWVVAGGESLGDEADRLVERCDHWAHTEACHGTGWRPKKKAIRWMRQLRDDCQASATPFYLKQWPMPPYRPGGPAELDGREWREKP